MIILVWHFPSVDLEVVYILAAEYNFQQNLKKNYKNINKLCSVYPGGVIKQMKIP